MSTDGYGVSGAGIGKQPFAVSARTYIGARASVTHPPYLSVFIRFHPFCPAMLLTVARIRASVIRHTNARAQPRFVRPVGQVRQVRRGGRYAQAARVRVRVLQNPFVYFVYFVVSKKPRLSSVGRHANASAPFHLSSFIFHHLSFVRNSNVSFVCRAKVSCRIFIASSRFSSRSSQRASSRCLA